MAKGRRKDIQRGQEGTLMGGRGGEMGGGLAWGGGGTVEEDEGEGLWGKGTVWGRDMEEEGRGGGLREGRGTWQEDCGRGRGL